MITDPLQSQIQQLRMDVSRELEAIKSDLYGDPRGKRGLISEFGELRDTVISQTTTLRWVVVILIGVLVVSIANFILIAVLFLKG